MTRWQLPNCLSCSGRLSWCLALSVTHSWKKLKLQACTAPYAARTPQYLTVLRLLHTRLLLAAAVDDVLSVTNFALFLAGPCLFGLSMVPGLDYSLEGWFTAVPYAMLPAILMYSSWLFSYYNGWLRPANARFWSWELFLHSFCKPWWILQVGLIDLCL